MASSSRSSSTRPRSAAKQSAAKQSAAKKPAAKKPAAKRSAVRKSAAKKPAAKRAPAKKAAAKKAAAHYTKPALRERLKDDIMAGTKGGRAGQWSARKAQLLAHAYEEAGGGYKGGRDERQRHLSQWTDQEWTTADGAKAERADGTHRYLPKKAWEKLTAAQKQATDRKKVVGSRTGEQFVANTGPARRARKSAS
jgi:ATPase subunit of ABC transporter with duplicated ATPase domains